MKTRFQSTSIVFALLAFATLNVQLQCACAQGTAFTYQGKLNNGGAAAGGSYDFRFRLASDNQGNNYVGSPFLTNGVPVTNGLFTTTIDFGAGIFTGADYWLEVDVRTNGAGGYTALFPLQAVTPTPYAVFANSASTAVNLAGPLTLAQLPAAVVTNNQASVTLSNVTIGSSLNLPAPPVLIRSGFSPLLYLEDVGHNLFLGLGSGNQSENGFYNTAFGYNTLLNLIGGSYNTAVGYGALYSTTFGNYNTAVGQATMGLNVSGFDNTAVGYLGLHSNISGYGNVAVGSNALKNNTNGIGNTAVGYYALWQSVTNGNNIAIGYYAGNNITSTNNIVIGNSGSTGEANTIRIGGGQTKTFISGISGVTVASGVAVVVNSFGQLGITSSSQKFKQDIKPMEDASDVLLALRPVTFKYKPELDPQGIPQFGLVAEEVDKVDPDLVARDEKKQIYTVRYEAVNAMLLNEFLKQHQKVKEQNNEIRNLEKQLNDLQAAVKSLAEKK